MSDLLYTFPCGKFRQIVKITLKELLYQMNEVKKCYALTGVTGLLGRNVFFEILKNHLENLDDLTIILFGRASQSLSFQGRIHEIFFNEGVEYLSLDEGEHARFDLFLESQVSYLHLDLLSDEAISSSDLEIIQNQEINFFYHIAASTDFRNSPKVIESLNLQNVHGTAQILNLAEKLNVHEMSYVSSAYACGCTYGDVQPDYTNMNQSFRNHYEKTKLQGEILVKEYQERTGTRCRIFRPSTISGNLIENKKGCTPKFDVFYGWAGFFLKMKMRLFEGTPSIYESPLNIDFRIAFNENAGLNIVPADFAAKVMYQVGHQNLEGQYFHLVNNQETPHSFYLFHALNFFNITGYTAVNQVPEDLNDGEKLYYKTVGSIFNPYVNQDEIRFNVDNLKDLYSDQDLKCPQIDETQFNILFDYAKSKHFGFRMKDETLEEGVLA